MLMCMVVEGGGGYILKLGSSVGQTSFSHQRAEDLLCALYMTMPILVGFSRTNFRRTCCALSCTDIHSHLSM